MNAITRPTTRAGDDLVAHFEAEAERCQGEIDRRPVTAVTERSVWIGWRDAYQAAARFAAYAVPRIEREAISSTDIDGEVFAREEVAAAIARSGR